MLRSAVLMMAILTPAIARSQSLTVRNDIGETVRIYLRSERDPSFYSGLARKNVDSPFQLRGSDRFEVAIVDQSRVEYRLGFHALRQKVTSDPGYHLRLSGIFQAGTKEVWAREGRRRKVRRTVNVTQRNGLAATFHNGDGTTDGFGQVFEVPSRSW